MFFHINTVKYWTWLDESDANVVDLDELDPENPFWEPTKIDNTPREMEWNPFDAGDDDGFKMDFKNPFASTVSNAAEDDFQSDMIRTGKAALLL